MSNLDCLCPLCIYSHTYYKIIIHIVIICNYSKTSFARWQTSLNIWYIYFYKNYHYKSYLINLKIVNDEEIWWNKNLKIQGKSKKERKIVFVTVNVWVENQCGVKTSWSGGFEFHWGPTNIYSSLRRQTSSVISSGPY